MTTSREQEPRFSPAEGASPLNSAQADSGVRIVFESAVHHYEDLRRYEAEHQNFITDQMIFYASSVVDVVEKGEPYDTMFRLLNLEIPYMEFDIERLIGYLNHMLEARELPYRFDQTLNLTIEGIIAHTSLFTEEGIRQHQYYVQTLDEESHDEIVTGYGVKIIDGWPMHIVMPLFKADVVNARLDNTRVSRKLNDYLAEQGSTLRFNEYLEPIETPANTSTQS